MVLRSPEQWHGIASPVRLQMVAFFECRGPMSVAELAKLMDYQPDGLYHHIKILLTSGLIQKLGSRGKGRQTETVYDLTAEKLDFDFDGESGKNLEPMMKVQRAVLRNSSRVLDTAIQSGVAKLKGDERNFYSRYEAGWLNADELAKVREHVEAITEIFANAGNKTDESLLYMANCNVAPIIRKRGNESKNKS